MCLQPVILRNATLATRNGLMVSCGKCYECRAKRASNWAFRLEQEDRVQPCSLFITLTYSDENLVYMDGTNPSLSKRDLQLFFKRLRKNTKKQLKYYAVGEYGSRTYRPHYHAILFGVTDEDVIRAWQTDGQPIGKVHFGGTESASIRYVTNYLQKSIGVHPSGCYPEFSLMSKGLGKSYLTFARIKWHQANDANYVLRPGGKKQSLPRYYKDVIFDPDQRQYFGKQYVLEHNRKAAAEIKKIGLDKWHIKQVAHRIQTIDSAEYKLTLRNKI